MNDIDRIAVTIAAEIDLDLATASDADIEALYDLAAE